MVMIDTSAESRRLTGGFEAASRRLSIWATSALVKVFRRRPSRTIPHGQRPASENLQGTKPREGRIRRCLRADYGDLSVGGPQLSQPRGSVEP
jgi:hypothetical protein